MSFSDHDEEKREDCDSWDFVFGCSGDFEIWNRNESDSEWVFNVSVI